jgi:hypothetical protein
MSHLSVAKDFSRFPAGRYVADGPFPGEVFRDNFLVTALRGGPVTVQLDGTFGYGSSFLEEALGGLVRKCGFSSEQLHKLLTVQASDESLVIEVWSYIDAATHK